MTAKRYEPPPIEPREFRSAEEIDIAIGKLHRRIEQLESVDIPTSVARGTAAVTVCRSNIRDTIREVFGPNSPEFKEHGHIEIWIGAFQRGMSVPAIISTTQRGRTKVVGILNGLIARLQEKKVDLTAGTTLPISTSIDRFDLHPRIKEVSRDLFVDGHPWDAVFAASKALVNYVKERSGRHDLDGAPLMRDVFSRNNPVLVFNDLADQTDRDEQEGMMHLFKGAVLAIRNPGGHSFREGSEQRAMEYISFLSLLACRVQEAKKIK
jgi:uncharacterized protein (TIGR02391 family)